MLASDVSFSLYAWAEISLNQCFWIFRCSGTFRKCLRCSWKPLQWFKCLSYFL